MADSKCSTGSFCTRRSSICDHGVGLVNTGSGMELVYPGSCTSAECGGSGC